MRYKETECRIMTPTPDECAEYNVEKRPSAEKKSVRSKSRSKTSGSRKKRQT